MQPALLLIALCFGLGGLPLTGWLTGLVSGRRLAEVGTGNVGVSAAFYHGGAIAGTLAVLVEAGKGILAVLLARQLFADSTWQLIALIALVAGRYWLGKGAGTTNVVWGCVVYDWTVALLIFIIGGISFTLLRERQQGRIGVLILLPVIIGFQRHDTDQVIAAIALSSLLAWIYHQLPDDLDLKPTQAQTKSQTMFKFFRGDRAVLSLDQPLSPQQVGGKAATLSQLKGWGYAVPKGWVLPPGDDPEPLIESLDPSPEVPLVVRSSALSEDGQRSSAAGQYQSILNVTSRLELMNAITECQQFYHQPGAEQYRRDRGSLDNDGMAVLVQEQVKGVFSGVAFSRDPLQSAQDVVAIEALPGPASRVVSGQVNPEAYQVMFAADPSHPEELEIVGEPGDLPPSLIRQVALLARELEARYHGTPQDIEWSYDGQTLWLLQARPITTLSPIWTRKIAAEVIPGQIRPLTWSINQPLTCGVWGKLFRLVLGQRSQGLDFNATATLHYGRAYFNVDLLGQIFRRMGLPAESLEFLTRGAKMGRPSLVSTLKNVPGLLKLCQCELRLAADFRRDDEQQFQPLLEQLQAEPIASLDAATLLQRIEKILQALEQATYFSILAPLGLALWQVILRVQDHSLDTSQTAEAASLQELQAIAARTRHLLPNLSVTNSQQLFAKLVEERNGAATIDQLAEFLDRYGYMSTVGTDIAVPTWQEDPQPLWDLFYQYWRSPTPLEKIQPKKLNWRERQVQRRMYLKGRVSVVYSQLLAQLRWQFVALEQLWLQAGWLQSAGDIFFLEFSVISQAIEHPQDSALEQFPQMIAQQRSHFEQESQISSVPAIVYGHTAHPVSFNLHPWTATTRLQGIGASPGQAEGEVRIVLDLQAIAEVNAQMILVVPYTDAGWAPLLARAGGLIAEVGGRLSHGAIIAREYGIPAVMEIDHATQRLKDGQRVRIDGQQGIVEIL
ncbi:MAG: glycerol-3-phosphate acyltransferase [Aphanocapsa sp. GSE-SYN-MK-11-07L]|nr:glycerol-3-phosphate acyltransferase [Aphanocapsa sp. GSE-SYN-MK-11-07L]